MKTVFELHMMGGPIFMFVHSILLVVILVLSGIAARDLFLTSKVSPKRNKNILLSIIYLGGFSLVWGILGQGLGIYQALWAIQQAGDISPAIIIGGVKISMISPLYGMIIFLISSVFWYILKARYNLIQSPA